MTCLLVWLTITPGYAEQPSIDVGVSGEVGLLWKIQKPGQPPSHLFGTIHVDDPRVMELSPPVVEAFRQATSFTMEMVAQTDDLATMSRKMFFSDGTTLPQVLGKVLYADTRRILIKRGLETDGLEVTKPWVIVMMLSTPRPKSGLFLDMKLYRDAVQAGKPGYGLESMGEQLAAFDEMTMPDQIVLLKQSLAMSDQFNQQLEQLLQAYLSRDLRRIQDIANAQRPREGETFDRFMERLIHARNRRMLERMQPRLREGNAFIAVGALHLPGPTGLLALLKAQGFKVIPIW